MADEPQELCERLFTTFLAPLVLGGTMRPSHAFGGRNALAIGEGKTPSDVDLLSRVTLARVRVARRIVPVDRFEPAPTAAEWALAAMLSDLVVATHPDFDSVLRRGAPRRMLEIADMTLERIPKAATVGDMLSRHTWLGRMFEITRTDVEVRWWTGSQKFLGADPPARLLAWPELRRVQQTKTPHTLMDLPSAGSAIDPGRFTSCVTQLLAHTPLTDFVTLDRAAPSFAWTPTNLALASTHAGRTAVLRALAQKPNRVVDAALGRATRPLFNTKATRALLVAVDLLRDRALAAATARLGHDRDPEPLAPPAENADAALAISAGALVATFFIGQTGGGFNDRDRRAVLEILRPAAEAPAARDVRALLSA